jgi:hypothetical protein
VETQRVADVVVGSPVVGSPVVGSPVVGGPELPDETVVWISHGRANASLIRTVRPPLHDNNVPTGATTTFVRAHTDPLPANRFTSAVGITGIDETICSTPSTVRT